MKQFAKAIRVSGADTAPSSMKVKGWSSDVSNYVDSSSRTDVGMIQYSEGDAVYTLAGHFENKTTEGAPIPFAVGQVVKTRDGRNAKIIDVDLRGNDCMVVAKIEYRNLDGGEFLVTCGADGSYYGDCGIESPLDLIPNRAPAISRLVFVPASSSGEAINV